MQQAVWRQFPDVQATYRFTNRDKDTLFSRQCVEQFRTSISQFTNLILTNAEREWLHATCPFLTTEYLEYLSSYRFKPEQISVTFVPTADAICGNLEIEVSGPWVETILWEVPLMAALSQCYFHTVVSDWNYDGQAEQAYKKGRALLEAGCAFSDFGTRRRRSFEAQESVVKALGTAAQDHPESRGDFRGTSNVHLARKYGLTPIGTIAHEWFMGVAALKGYERTHLKAMDLWEAVYPNAMLVALTDTFTTEAFYKDFASDPDRARKWTGLRQDSGDPFKFGPRVKGAYESLGIDPKEKVIVHSDALSVDKAVRLQKLADELGLNASFGIGTFFTNDFKTLSSGGREKSKALNIVIKLASVDGEPCVKLSDDLTKTTGDAATVQHVKELYGIASPCVV